MKTQEGVTIQKLLRSDKSWEDVKLSALTPDLLNGLEGFRTSEGAVTSQVVEGARELELEVD